MFLDLFYGLRDEGVPVAIQEWQAFLSALEQGLHGADLLRFYHLGRACLVKSETYFDAYDRVFAKVFKGVEGALGDTLTEELLDWLREQQELRKKPSTSELVDWISALLKAGVTTDQIEAHIPFLGALLKKEQDVDALQRYDEKSGKYPQRWADLGPRYNQ